MAHQSVDANEADPLLHLNESHASSSFPDAIRASTTAITEYRHSATTDNADKESSKSLAEQLEGLSLYEKKCILIDREIDLMGMGRYQWSIWTLCGLGYLIDLMWAQAFGLVLSPMQQELGFGPNQTGKLSTAFSVGLTAGAFAWGILIDVFGRRWAFNLTVLVACVFGTSIAIPSTYNSILVLTALTGFGVGGNIPVDTTITLEATPRDKRYLLPLLSIFQPIGVVICSVLAYGFVPNYSCSPNFSEKNPLPSCSAVPSGDACCIKENNMGWRYLLFTLGIVTLIVFFLRTVVFRLQESPNFLLCRGHDVKALEVLHAIAQYNQRHCTLTLEDLESLESDFESTRNNEPTNGSDKQQLEATWSEKLITACDRFKILFSSYAMTRLTLLVWLTYICDYWGFTVAGIYSRCILTMLCKC